jgi:hypothetical protein
MRTRTRAQRLPPPSLPPPHTLRLNTRAIPLHLIAAASSMAQRQLGSKMTGGGTQVRHPLRLAQELVG